LERREVLSVADIVVDKLVIIIGMDDG